jgi:pilus assembly protein CpaB
MRARTIFAILALVMASIVVVAMYASPKGDASQPKEQVLAAATELSTGTLLREQDLTWQTISQTEADQIVRPNAAAAVEGKPEVVEETAASVYGAVLRRPLVAGAPIRRGDIVKPGERDFLKVVLPMGARAIAIPVATGGASTGLLSPGDRVDVILTQSFKSEAAGEQTPITRRSVGETIVQNLRVLAIDSKETKPTGITANAANGNFGRTVTLEVTPEQAEKINVAAELGKLSVTLLSTHIADDPNKAIKPQWAGDVSPALLGTAIPKPIALKPASVMILRGRITDERLRAEVVKPESDTDADKRR